MDKTKRDKNQAPYFQLEGFLLKLSFYCTPCLRTDLQPLQYQSWCWRSTKEAANGELLHQDSCPAKIKLVPVSEVQPVTPPLSRSDLSSAPSHRDSSKKSGSQRWAFLTARKQVD